MLDDLVADLAAEPDSYNALSLAHFLTQRRKGHETPSPNFGLGQSSSLRELIRNYAAAEIATGRTFVLLAVKLDGMCLGLARSLGRQPKLKEVVANFPRIGDIHHGRSEASFKTILRSMISVGSMLRHEDEVREWLCDWSRGWYPATSVNIRVYFQRSNFARVREIVREAVAAGETIEHPSLTWQHESKRPPGPRKTPDGRTTKFLQRTIQKQTSRIRYLEQQLALAEREIGRLGGTWTSTVHSRSGSASDSDLREMLTTKRPKRT